jgi:hypothetical protein
VKFGTAVLTHYVKQFTDGRITVAALEKVVDQYTGALSDQIVSMASFQKAQSVIATARHANILTRMASQQEQIARANEILAKLEPDVLLEIFKNFVTVTVYLKAKEMIRAFLASTRGKVTVALMLLLIVRVFDMIILGGLLTKGVIGTTKGSYKATRYLFKKISGTRSTVKKLVYSMMTVVSMRMSKKNSPAKFNTRPVINLTNKSPRNKSPVNSPNKSRSKSHTRFVYNPNGSVVKKVTTGSHTRFVYN